MRTLPVRRVNALSYGTRHNGGNRLQTMEPRTTVLRYWRTRIRQETHAMGSARRITLRVKPPAPLGEVAVVPAPLSGRPEAEMARAMAAALADDESATAADLYSRVHQAFPFAPLSARLGALAVLMDKIRRPAH